jgi:predicted PurR-regulated permease PerM
MPTWVTWIWLTLGALFGVWLVWRLAEIVLLLAVALVLTCALLPVVDWMCSRGFSRQRAVTTSILGLFGIFALAIAVLAPVVVEQTAQIVEAIPTLPTRLHWIEGLWGTWRARFPLLPEFASAFEWASGTFAGSVNLMLGLTGRFLVFLAGAFTVLFLTFFFLRDGERLLEDVLQLAPIGRRAGTHEVVGRIGGRVGRYVLGQLTVMGLLGTMAAIGLALVGLPYAATLGLLVALLDIIPYFGPFIAAVPGLAIGFSLSWQQGLAAAFVYVAVQQIEGFVLTPTIAGRAVGLHPVWIMLSILAGGSLLGVIGAVLAVPAAVALQILLEELVVPRVTIEAVQVAAPPRPGVQPPGV